jgi:exonuclease III
MPYDSVRLQCSTITNVWAIQIKKINKATTKLNDTIHQIYLSNIYRASYPEVAQYKFFSASHGTFSKVDHILVNKENHYKYRKVEITSCILSDHSGIKLELNNKRNYVNCSNT